MHLVEPAFLPQPQGSSDDMTESAEQHIGMRVASLAALFGAVVLLQNGNPTPEAKRRGAELLSELVKLALTWPQFHQIARAEGRAALHKYCATNLAELDEAWLDQLIEEALTAISTVARKVSN
jgi:hypothetical protein